MLSTKEYREAEKPAKEILKQIEDLWSDHEQFMAALYLKSGWDPQQIGAHEHGGMAPKGARADIKRMFRFAFFVERFGHRFPKLRFHEFKTWNNSYPDDFEKIAECIEKMRNRHNREAA